MDQVKYSFTAGELAEELLGRSDIELYDLGAKSMINAVVNYGGGAFKRRGTRFTQFADGPDDPARIIPLVFSDDFSLSYLMVLTTSRIRFIAEGGYVLNGVTYSRTMDGAGNITRAAHGYLPGQFLVIGADVYRVTDRTTNTFKLQDFRGQILIRLGLFDLSEVFELSHPYSTVHFTGLQISQDGNEVRFAHQSYPVYVLTKQPSLWTFTPESRPLGKPLPQTPVIEHSGAYITYIRIKNDGAGYNENASLQVTDSGPGTGFQGYLTVDPGGEIESVQIIDGGRGYINPSAAVVGGGGSGAVLEIERSVNEAGFIMAISAVLSDGRETGITRPAIIRNSVDFTRVKGSATYSWQKVSNIDGADAVSYNVYRSLVLPNGADIHLGYALGFIGNTKSTTFTDNNITPDFTRTPIIYRDPFEDGQIVSVTPENGGRDYAASSVGLTVETVDGAGFVGYPITDKGGAITGVYVANPGRNYRGNNNIVVTGGGAGVNGQMSFKLSALSGNNPNAAFKFQRRYCYAGTRNQPMTVWGSRIDELNFGENVYPTDNDPWEYTIDAKKLSPIRHVLPSQNGLLLFTSSSIALMRGAQGQPISVKAAQLDVQSSVGISSQEPLFVGDDIVYVPDGYRSLHMLSYDASSQRYGGNEISILSRHLFDGKAIRGMDFAYISDKQGYLVRADGLVIVVTLDRGQKVYGFSRMSTQGRVKDVAVIRTGSQEHIYFLVRRRIGGVYVHTIERIVPEESQSPEDAIYLDMSLSTPKIRTTASVSLSGLSGTVVLNSTDTVFASDVAGRVIGIRNGRGIIEERLNNTRLRINLTRAITPNVEEVSAPYLFGPADWWMNEMQTEISSIPFEGETVNVVADGVMQNPKVVAGGKITLDYPAAIVTIGLPYRFRVDTLPITNQRAVLEGRRLSINEVSVRIKRAGPFSVGDGEKQYDAYTRTNEPWAEPPVFREGFENVPIATGWNEDGTISIQQDSGLPCEITQVVYDVSVGD